MTACIVSPVVLTRVDQLVWQPFAISPIPGTSIVLELPKEPNPGRDDVTIGCDGKPYREGLAYSLCKAPLAYYPPRYGWMVRYNVFVEPRTDLSIFGPPYLNSNGVQWQFLSRPTESGGTAFVTTALSSDKQLTIQVAATVKTPDGYLERIAREGAERFRIAVGK